MQAQGSDSVDSNYYLPKNTFKTIDPEQIENNMLKAISRAEGK